MSLTLSPSCFLNIFYKKNTCFCAVCLTATALGILSCPWETSYFHMHRTALWVLSCLLRSKFHWLQGYCIYAPTNFTTLFLCLLSASISVLSKLLAQMETSTGEVYYCYNRYCRAILRRSTVVCLMFIRKKNSSSLDSTRITELIPCKKEIVLKYISICSSLSSIMMWK